jgi:hypothetical protein
VHLAEESVEEARSPAALEAQLRRTYADAVVRRRDVSGEIAEVWYCYRDGHWVRSDEHREH